MNLDHVRNIFISSPASTGRTNQILEGNLFIGNSTSLENKNESVKIAFSVSRREHQREISEWINILNSQSITTKPKAAFLISRNDWQSTGLTWVIATPIFEKTPVKIVIEGSELLEPGFKIEIFTRDALIVREVPPNRDLASGAKIDFEISWTIGSNSSTATPVVVPAVEI